ncbi:MAG: aminotransferase class V-fold PLP-dependent enzyme [Gemmatimonadetes bacterium]|nr:aminotransferase class V-fold PLP-dependent enzyme [Gemmatimonadota bacterium]
MTYRSGRHFLQLPGPTNVPERILRAMSRPTIDHRGPEFQELAQKLLIDSQWLFGTEHPVLVHPSSASGAWEAAIANTLSPGDRVLVFDQGFFAAKWAQVAERFGLEVQLEAWEPRRGLAADAMVDVLRDDVDRRIKAVLVVHNETSTGVTTDIEVLAVALRESEHPALLFVDAVSSLGATPVEHDAWGIDVTVSGSQKGLMLPPGLSFLAVGPRALEARKTATLPRSYWDWDDQLNANAEGAFPYTPATNLLFGLAEAIAMLREEGLPEVFARHRRFAMATRTAVAAWGLDTFATDPLEASSAVTAVLVPPGSDADALRAVILDCYDMSLGSGLGPFKGKLFRIGHLGHLNALTLMGTLAGIEMGLALAGVPHTPGGVDAAMGYLTTEGAA